MESQDNIAGVARAAMLVYVSISTYSGRKQDKQTQTEVTNAKGAASKRAASVYKSLFADCKELDDITKYASRIRTDHMYMTLPWSDSGLRLLPTKALLDYQARMTAHEQEFRILVDKFLDRYDTLVAAAAFQLGTLFDRSEYPLRAEVAQKFNISTTFTPVPLAGDFRLDIESEVQHDLQNKYAKQMQQQLEQANKDSWDRLYDVLTKMSERLGSAEDGTKKVFRDSLVTNATELCDLLTKFNVTGDTQLERARALLEEALVSTTAKDLRESDGTRVEVKRKVDSILADFDWSIDDNETS